MSHEESLPPGSKEPAADTTKLNEQRRLRAPYSGCNMNSRKRQAKADKYKSKRKGRV